MFTNLLSKKIEMTKTEAAKAGKYNSPEYNELAALMERYDCFKRIVKKMGASELRFHDLRHTYAVISIKNGDDIKTVQNNLGHATASFTLDVYGHVTEQMKRDSSSRMEHFIQGISELR